MKAANRQGNDAGRIGRARDAAAAVPGVDIGSAEVYVEKDGRAPEGGGRHCDGPCVLSYRHGAAGPRRDPTDQ